MEKILQKYTNPGGWIADSEGSGQSEIFAIKFDFAPYVLRTWETEDGGKVYQRAFGVRTEYMSSNSTDRWTRQSLSLFLPDYGYDTQLAEILSGFEVYLRTEREDENHAGQNICHEAKTILMLSKQTSGGGYADIIAKTKVKETVETASAKDQPQIVSEKDLTAAEGGKRVLKYNGVRYTDPED